MTQDQSIRYARHTMLPEVGRRGRSSCSSRRCCCLGAGGLGSPSGFYLAAAGVGTLGMIDDDVVDSSNLQRQILHSHRSGRDAQGGIGAEDARTA